MFPRYYSRNPLPTNLHLQVCCLRTQPVIILSYDSRDNIIWERKIICSQVNFASKISAPSILYFLKWKRIAAKIFSSFYFSCEGSVWALPWQILKLCESIQHDFRNSLPIIYMPRQMYCYPSSRADEYLMRYLKHYYMKQKKNKSTVKKISNTSLCPICRIT